MDQPLKISKLILLFSCMGFVLNFQNCGSVHEGNQIKLNSLDQESTGQSPTVRKIWQMNRALSSELPIVIYANPQIFPPESIYVWIHKFSGVTSACEQKNYLNHDNAVELICPSEGSLQVELYITNVLGEVIILTETLSVSRRDSFSSNELEPLLNGIENLVVDIDGNPGGLANSSEGYSLRSESTILYGTSCKTCHGSLEASNVRGKNLADLNRSINQITEMKTFQRLSDRERKGLVEILGGS
ncbi:MAG: hypothetical protein IPK68_00630 [Bdellovibrionales bacterium]|nr:hypothetical protein [Bdellovibrionales bacterium]